MVSAATNLGANAAKRYLEINTSKATRATEELASGSKASNPSYDPSSSAVGYRLSANLQSLIQASSNVSQATAMIQMATGSLGATQDILTRVKELTVKANTDSVGDGERKMMNDEFQQLIEQVTINANNARWGGVSLFSGGAGDATPNGGPTPQNASGLGTSPAFDGTLSTANTQGNITGYAVDATVKANGSLYDVTVVISEQTFKATVGSPVNGGTLTLVSVSDPGSSISFNYSGTAATITDPNAFQTSLQTTLGIGSGLTRASFVSASAGDPIIGTTLKLSAGSGTNAGTWALTYDYDATTFKGTFRVSRGTEYYTAVIDRANYTDPTQVATTVSFSNGISLALDTFNMTNDLAQETFQIVAGEQIIQAFQYGEKATDMLSVTFKGATAEALELAGLTILTMEAAQKASSKIDAAQDQVGSMIAELGGKAAQLGFMTDTLMISIQNQTAARSTFIDANIADSMMTLQRFKGLAQVANSVFTQALNEQSQLTEMVQQVR